MDKIKRRLDITDHGPQPRGVGKAAVECLAALRLPGAHAGHVEREHCYPTCLDERVDQTAFGLGAEQAVCSQISTCSSETVLWPSCAAWERPRGVVRTDASVTQLISIAMKEDHDRDGRRSVRALAAALVCARDEERRGDVGAE